MGTLAGMLRPAGAYYLMSDDDGWVTVWPIARAALAWIFEQTR
jgi:hypothetical protein